MVVNYVKTNPHKSQAKLESMNNIMAVCLTIFGIMWAFSPDRLNGPILLQFVLAIPLLYVSGLAYTKVAYRKEVKFWDNFGWFTSTVATAFVLNIVGILIFLLGRVQIASII
ncbi:hypothetical protein J4403_01430 [Candidatus Woesearchaeota archaeon]|nr:hypothetical protein [Candidatus Woesearchaeota archaeon]